MNNFTGMTASIVYTGELRCELTHDFSKTKILTDAPLDNQGKAQAFSPTDLVATAAGACALTIMGIAARERGFSIDGAAVEVTKVMAANPRRISEIQLRFSFPKNNYTDEQKRLIEHISRTCPVMQSIHPDIKKEITIQYH